MYHYIKEKKNNDFPNLNYLEFKEFRRQINFFKKKFNILDNNQFCEILYSKKIPKKKSVLLTFDDGYYDHYNYVYPELVRNKISGLFYPTVETIENNVLLDVNKIQLILEKEKNRDKLLENIFKLIHDLKNKKKIISNISKIKLESRWDDKKTVLIKRLLQYYLPKNIRNLILEKLYNEIVSIDEEILSKTFYINKKHIQEMHSNGMTFGGHGHKHFWLGKLNSVDQEKDIKKTINFFKKLKIYNNNFSFCYPYGSFNNHTIKILKKFKVSFALTTNKNSLTKRNLKERFVIPRFDTNDFK
ncbi:polysaccharide deacetylase family protein [Candidatus Pelagibacter sp. HIMB1636]